MPIILSYKGIMPRIAPTAFIADNATIIGDVEIGEYSNVWFGCVIRGDVNTIRIGSRTNIQDGCMIHVTRGTGPTRIGSGITIGHMVLMHACTIEDDAFVGMGSILLDDATVGSGGMLAAGSMLTSGKTVKAGELWAGSPAKMFRPMSQAERDFIAVSAENYVQLAAEYQKQ